MNKPFTRNIKGNSLIDDKQFVTCICSKYDTNVVNSVITSISCTEVNNYYWGINLLINFITNITIGMTIYLNFACYYITL